jgi:hypothetical protein
MATQPTIQPLPLAKIRTDGGTQVRVDRYAEALNENETFPPVVVFFSGSTYWLADGFHRLKAHEKAGRTEIECEVHEGQRSDAILYAVGTNARHGKPRTSADKRKAVKTLFKNQEWAQWTDREIARRCCVSPTFVGEVRRTLSTVDSSPNRTYSRAGQTQTMDVSNIGQGRKADGGSDETASAPAEKAKSRPEATKPTLRGVRPKQDNRPTFPPETLGEKPRGKQSIQQPAVADKSEETEAEDQGRPASSLLDQCRGEIEALVRKWVTKGLTADQILSAAKDAVAKIMERSKRGNPPRPRPKKDPTDMEAEVMAEGAA